MKKAGIILVIFLLLASSAYLLLSVSVNKELKALVYEDIDMSRIEDGTYYGEAKAGPVYVKVSVTVVSNVISNIEIIEHSNGLGSKAEKITEAMLTQNTYAVDSVSGATVSSKTIKSAVSKALKEGYTGL